MIQYISTYTFSVYPNISMNTHTHTSTHTHKHIHKQRVKEQECANSCYMRGLEDTYKNMSLADIILKDFAFIFLAVCIV